MINTLPALAPKTLELKKHTVSHIAHTHITRKITRNTSKDFGPQKIGEVFETGQWN